jgi:hypothetical protein
MEAPMKAIPRWSVRLGKERRVRARTPVFGDGAVYQVFHYDKGSFIESVMLALDAETGVERWRSTIAHVANEPVLAPDGSVYLSSFEGSVFAYAKDGRLLWKAPEAGRNMGVPRLVDAGRLVVAEIGGGGSRTWCLDRHSGAVLWTFDNGGHSYPIAATAKMVVHATAVSGARFGESTIHLFALSAENGRPIWSVKHDKYLFTPRIVDDLVVIGARGALLAYHLANGRPAARLDLPPDTAVNVLASAPGGFLLADDTPAFAADNTPILRRVALSRKRAFLRPSAEFTELWATSLPRAPIGRPIPFGSVVAVLVEGGDLHILSASDGQRIAVCNRKGDENGGGGIACSGAFLAVANGRTLDIYRQSDIVDN